MYKIINVTQNTLEAPLECLTDDQPEMVGLEILKTLNIIIDALYELEETPFDFVFNIPAQADPSDFSQVLDALSLCINSTEYSQKLSAKAESCRLWIISDVEKIRTGFTYLIEHDPAIILNGSVDCLGKAYIKLREMKPKNRGELADAMYFFRLYCFADLLRWDVLAECQQTYLR